jgi:ribosomal protein L28
VGWGGCVCVCVCDARGCRTELSGGQLLCNDVVVVRVCARCVRMMCDDFSTGAQSRRQRHWRANVAVRWCVEASAGSWLEHGVCAAAIGVLCADYFKIRKLLYSQFKVL